MIERDPYRSSPGMALSDRPEKHDTLRIDAATSKFMLKLAVFGAGLCMILIGVLIFEIPLIITKQLLHRVTGTEFVERLVIFEQVPWNRCFEAFINFELSQPVQETVTMDIGISFSITGTLGEQSFIQDHGFVKKKVVFHPGTRTSSVETLSYTYGMVCDIGELRVVISDYGNVCSSTIGWTAGDVSASWYRLAFRVVFGTVMLIEVCVVCCRMRCHWQNDVRIAMVLAVAAVLWVNSGFSLYGQWDDVAYMAFSAFAVFAVLTGLDQFERPTDVSFFWHSVFCLCYLAMDFMNHPSVRKISWLCSFARWLLCAGMIVWFLKSAKGAIYRADIDGRRTVCVLLVMYGTIILSVFCDFVARSIPESYTTGILWVYSFISMHMAVLMMLYVTTACRVRMDEEYSRDKGFYE